MTALRRLLAVAALVCTLSACATAIDASRARICRSIIAALNAADATVEIVRTQALARGEGVRIDYLLRASAGGPHRRFLECRFAAAGQPSSERDRLTGVAPEGGQLGPLRLYLLQRFWLEREGQSADPEPVPNAARVPELPRTLAVGLQHLLSALPSIAIYALLAAAYSLIYGLVHRINLAFGELAA